MYDIIGNGTKGNGILSVCFVDFMKSALRKSLLVGFPWNPVFELNRIEMEYVIVFGGEGIGLLITN